VNTGDGGLGPPFSSKRFAFLKEMQKTASATGDLAGNVRRLIDHLKSISYHRSVSARLLRAGDPTALLPILHYSLLDYSPYVASFISSHGYDLYGRDDASFTTAVFRLANLHLGIQPGIQAQQFLSRGFVGAWCRTVGLIFSLKGPLIISAPHHYKRAHFSHTHHPSPTSQNPPTRPNTLMASFDPRAKAAAGSQHHPCVRGKTRRGHTRGSRSSSGTSAPLHISLFSQPTQCIYSMEYQGYQSCGACGGKKLCGPPSSQSSQPPPDHFKQGRAPLLRPHLQSWTCRAGGGGTHGGTGCCLPRAFFAPPPALSALLPPSYPSLPHTHTRAHALTYKPLSSSPMQ